MLNKLKEVFHIISKIERIGGVPTLVINNNPIYNGAYITYLTENARYDDFNEADCRIFSFSTFFAKRSINHTSGIKPFEDGIFEEQYNPNFKIFDAQVERILKVADNAYIIPRINIMLPKWWEDNNPDETNHLISGEIVRESFSSLKWRAEVIKRLELLIDHIEKSDYKEHIAGYHIAGGQTEEFFHFGSPYGNFGDCSKKNFINFIKENYPNEVNIVTDLPTYPYNKEEFCEDIATVRFLEYTSLVIANSICDFANAIKTYTNNNLIVGSFYGYTMEICDPRFGHHAMEKVLNCEDLDFIAAPNSYINGRAGGIDWANMSVLDSVKLHNKFFFCECDTRTYLTKSLMESRENSCLPNTYKDGVWIGPDNPIVSKWLLRNNFARQLTHSCGYWWFDMWGNWFSDKDIMIEMKEYNKIAQNSLKDKNRQSIAQVAVIVDEKSYKFINPNTNLQNKWCYDNRTPLGLSGVPYDIFDIYDIDKIEKNYKLVIFLNTLIDNGLVKNFVEELRKNGGKLMFTYKPFSIKKPTFEIKSKEIYEDYSLNVKVLKEAYKRAGVHIYCETQDVLYVNENFVSLHSELGGEKTIYLNKIHKVTELFTNKDSFYSNEIHFNLEKFETKLFRKEKLQ